MANKRKLIQENETKISILQIIGFVFMIGSIIYLIANLFGFSVTPKDISVNFFVIMVGFAFAFPSLLEGNEGLSTMRIIVFMMTNVICMLLLKIGWAEDIHNLKAIGLDEYWMGVIAFVFGAKATQSFFENWRPPPSTKDAVPNEPNSNSIDEQSNLPMANINIITEAIKNKGKEWVNSFPNVTGFSTGYKTVNNKQTDIPALICKVTNKKNNLNFGSIPNFLNYTAQDGNTYKIQTDVLQENQTIANDARIKFDEQPFPLGNSISRRNDESTGSVGLVLKKDGDANSDYIISCYHVFCDPELRNSNRTFQNTNENAKLICASVEDKGTNYVADVILGYLTSNSDFAIAKVREGVVFENQNSNLGIRPNGFGFVFSENIGESLTLCGRTSGLREGKIKNHHASQTIYYCSNTVTEYIDGFIEVDKFCEPGDSGCVVLNSKNQIVGLVVGSSLQSSYVLPVKSFILTNNYSLKI
ncbi:S1 family peptidase [Parafilimonas sp.]|uniref:S1 family peptidase n=1 Tax=Parafilimonas sp. TaxID=1969739 RepID=UPI0039E55D6C